MGGENEKLRGAGDGLLSEGHVLGQGKHTAQAHESANWAMMIS